MGLFANQLLLSHNVRSTRCKTSKNDHYSTSSTDWSLVSSDHTVETFCINLSYDQRETTHADMCFSKISFHSVYYFLHITFGVLLSVF